MIIEYSKTTLTLAMERSLYIGHGQNIADDDLVTSAYDQFAPIGDMARHLHAIIRRAVLPSTQL